MKTKKHITVGFDIDNVIADFDGMVLAKSIEEDKNKRNAGIINPGASWIRGMFDWSKEEWAEFFNNNMEKWASEFEVRPGAKEVIDALLEEGYDVVLISHRAAPHYKEPFETTKNWLKNNNINYTNLIISESTDKTKECRDNGVNIYFDDLPKNVEDLRNGGFENAYVVETEFNSNTDHNILVNWNTIYNKIKEVEREILSKPAPEVSREDPEFGDLLG